MADLLYNKEFSVHSYELDAEGLARPVSLLNFLQDAAGDHATQLGWSVLDLLKRNMTWVLSRYHVRVERYPGWGERIAVLTWPSGRRGYFALRDFEVSDGDGRAVAAATTSWMILDLNRKQPLKVDDILPDNFVVAKRALADDFAPLPVLDRADRELSFRVDSSHLDLNRHVNNAVYVQWALEAALSESGRRRPVDIEVAYRAEAFLHDPVISRVQAVPGSGGPEAGPDPEPVFLHQIINAATGAELTRLRSRWK